MPCQTDGGEGKSREVHAKDTLKEKLRKYMTDGIH